MNITIYVGKDDEVTLKDAKEAASKLDISFSGYVMIALIAMNLKTNKLLRIE